jgi:hypothetical protein
MVGRVWQTRAQSEAYPKLIQLQQARERRSLRGMRTAPTSFRRGSRALQIAARIGKSSVVEAKAQIAKPCAESTDSARGRIHSRWKAHVPKSARRGHRGYSFREHGPRPFPR